MKTKKGRKPITEGLESRELEEWIKVNDKNRALIKCQALFSLSKGVKVSEICNVLNITRESIRVWRNQFQKDGIDALIMSKKRKGRNTQFTNELKSSLIKNLGKPPGNFGYDQKIWDGKLVVEYLKKEWNITVSVRTAQNWINKLGIRKNYRTRISFK